jgi:hypothetical protein
LIVSRFVVLRALAEELYVPQLPAPLWQPSALLCFLRVALALRVEVLQLQVMTRYSFPQENSKALPPGLTSGLPWNC